MKTREEKLEEVIKKVFWMARRYAHGRHTYAAGMVRDAYMTLMELGIHIEHDKTIEPPKDFGEGMNLRQDYLDDINA